MTKSYTARYHIARPDPNSQSSGVRTQFLKRMVELVDLTQKPIQLLYDPPYHSKYFAHQKSDEGSREKATAKSPLAQVGHTHSTYMTGNFDGSFRVSECSFEVLRCNTLLLVVKLSKWITRMPGL